MAIKVQSQAEPIPGYRLIERLGGGGFGEVWKAEAPGGLFKAIKFVYGDIEGADDEGARADQELKALKRVQSVHHPYILSLERYDIIDGQLIIVMELADKTLWDRYKEFRRLGKKGIPREELLGYLRETAEALDLMNNQYQLQHLDIKPQNLFLVHNHVKVADFGLVKDLEGWVASVTGGVTPVYAAPETFDGWVSRFSDQYSLAIVYQEILTGKRPFAGTTVRQLIVQHLQATPDLSSLPEEDRPAIARALSKTPEQRYPSCTEFVEALMNSAGENFDSLIIKGDSLPDKSAPTKGMGERFSDDPPSTGSLATEQRPDLRPDRGGFAPPPLPWEEDGPDSDDLTSDPQSSGSSGILTGSPTKPATDEDVPRKADSANTERVPSADLKGLLARTPSGSGTSTADRLRLLSGLRTDSEGTLMPTLLVGLGSFGQLALQEYRQQMLDVYGGLSHLPHLRFLYLDTDSESLKNSTRGSGAALLQTETLHVQLHRASHYLKPGAKGALEKWLHPKMLYRIPRDGVPDGWRALGRLAFIDHYRSIVRRVETELRACIDPEALKLASHRTSLGVRTAVPRVYVITSLGGGTGSGMFIDLGYVVQSVLRRLGISQPDVVGMFLLPPKQSGNQSTPAQPNSLAALTELQHFSHPEHTFSAFYDERDETLQKGMLIDTGPPYQRCVLLPAEQKDSRSSNKSSGHRKGPPPGAELAAKLIFTENLTPLGRKVDDTRHAWAEAHYRRVKDPSQRAVFQTCGLQRIHWPRRRLLRMAAESLCQQLVDGWMDKDASVLAEGIKDWVEQQWDDFDLAPERLIERARDKCAEILGEDPQTTIKAITAPLTEIVQQLHEQQGKPARGRAPEPKLSMGTIVQTTHKIEELLGVPEAQEAVGVGPQNDQNNGQVGRALKKFFRKFASRCEVKLAELFVRLIESPQYRLAAAEENIRQFAALVSAAIEHQEELAKELAEKALHQYQELTALIEYPEQTSVKETGGWRLSFTRKTNSGTNRDADTTERLIRLLQSYPKIRYQAQVLEAVGHYYVSLRGLLSDQLREVDFCRHRLRELRGKFQAFADESPTEGTESTENSELNGRAEAPKPANENHGHFGQFIFPERVGSLGDAVRRLERSLTEEDRTEFDTSVQKLIRKKFKALVQVCMTSTSVLRTLVPAMLIEAETFLERHLQTEDVVRMYFSHLGSTPETPEDELDDFISGDLIRLFEKSAPGITSSSGQEFCWVAAPESPLEPKLREIAKKALARRIPNATQDGMLESAPAVDEVIVYRERLHKALPGIKNLEEALDLYKEMIQSQTMTPHTRIDIATWTPLES